MKFRMPYIALAVIMLASCKNAPDAAPAAQSTPSQPGDVTLLWRADPPVAPESLDDARYDPSWRNASSLDSGWVNAYDSTGPRPTPLPDSAFSIAETWEDIGLTPDTGTAAGRAPDEDMGGPPVLSLPLGGKVAGPSVLEAQVLLDLAHFSPGVLDGRWGGNVERAVFWLQRQAGLPATGQMDSATVRRVWELAGRPEELVGRRALDGDDVSGPFVQLPDDVYEQEGLECLCYTSLTEKLAELAHTTPELLEKLNPGTDLDALAAGDSIHVPLAGRFAVASSPNSQRPTGMASDASTPAQPDTTAASGSLPASADSAPVARIIVSDQGRYLHALDAAGRILFHFPATLGSDYFPSPTGDYRVTSVTEDPWFHYQPALLEGKDPSKPTARLAPGPNSPVGGVWIGLSKEHFGIHGTATPERIGYVTSSGCVRLTNWDALLLARSVKPGVIVEFRDVAREAGAAEN